MSLVAYADVFVPTAFLARKHHPIIHHENRIVLPIGILRGGGTNKEVDEDGEWEEIYDEEDEEEEDEGLAEVVEEELQEEDAVEEDEEELVEEEEIAVAEEDEEEIPVVIEEAAAPEEEPSIVQERAYTDDENSLSFVDSMEARIANTNTDDENSSAFVDRMDLADAYDEVDAAAASDQEEDSALAAVTAATAIGGADDVVPEEGEDAEGTAVAPLELSQEVKDTLKSLKYKAREIASLRPEVATELAEKGLQRPQEGLPANWFVEGASVGVSVREQALKISLVLAALGGLAFVGSNAGGVVAAVPAILKSLLPKKATTLAKATTSPLITETEVSLVEEEEVEDDHPHSVKPNSTSPPAYEKDLDKSLLDKVITKIGDLLKAIWNAKI